MPSLDNSCSLLRMLVTVDSKPTRLSEQSIIILGQHLSEYLMDAVQVRMLPKTLTSHQYMFEAMLFPTYMSPLVLSLILF